LRTKTKNSKINLNKKSKRIYKFSSTQSTLYRKKFLLQTKIIQCLKLQIINGIMRLLFQTKFNTFGKLKLSVKVNLIKEKISAKKFKLIFKTCCLSFPIILPNFSNLQNKKDFKNLNNVRDVHTIIVQTITWELLNKNLWKSNSLLKKKFKNITKTRKNKS
jgi:hypothetical protein